MKVRINPIRQLIFKLREIRKDPIALIILLAWFGLLWGIRMLLRSELHSWIGGTGAVAISFGVIFLLFRQTRFKKVSVKVKSVLGKWYTRKAVRAGTIMFILFNAAYYGTIELGYQQLTPEMTEQEIQAKVDSVLAKRVVDPIETLRLTALYWAIKDKANGAAFSNLAFIMLIEALEAVAILMIARHRPRLLGL